MTLRFSRLESICEVSPEIWDALICSNYPFLRHAYLAALEQTGATGEGSGWVAHHLLAFDDAVSSQVPVLAVPQYLKLHSYGEYVFDWSWARAYRQGGLEYYPKLVQCAPFAPATGPRILAGAAPLADNHLTQVAAFTRDDCRENGYSGAHLLFPEKSLSDELEKLEFAQRLGVQFHWRNHGYRDFADFLSGFVSRKRKNVQKERKIAQDSGLELLTLTGAELGPAQWGAFYRFYRATYEKRSGHGGYLNHNFFVQLGETMPESVVMTVAQREGVWQAAALALRDDTTLYGRYWGCNVDVPGLHFELCYYRFLEYAMENRLERFDPGAQGEHKIARGFSPTLTYSNHWIAHPGGREAILRFLKQEADGVREYARAASELLPFRRENACDGES